MSTVTIYQYLVLDPNLTEMRRSQRWATREGIESLKLFAKILEDTAAR
jgi:hypothetical protein